MFKELKSRVCKANIELKNSGIVIYTWGNASEIDSTRKYVAIKPSGVPYDKLSDEDIVIVDMNGNKVEGDLNPSTDLDTHLEIYKANSDVYSVVHTHSQMATAFAQAGVPIIPLGTTHADYFYGEVPVTRDLTSVEIEKDYEINTGKVINETIKQLNIHAIDIPGILVKSHGVFSWGKTPNDAVHNAVVLEYVAKMNYYSINLNPEINKISQCLLDKHYLRKHGKNAYYGNKLNYD